MKQRKHLIAALITCMLLAWSTSYADDHDHSTHAGETHDHDAHKDAKTTIPSTNMRHTKAMTMKNTDMQQLKQAPMVAGLLHPLNRILSFTSRKSVRFRSHS
jgi:hypothetical protein